MTLRLLDENEPRDVDPIYLAHADVAAGWLDGFSAAAHRDVLVLDHRTTTPAAITCTLRASMSNEYVLVVNDDGVSIDAPTPEAVFWALQTLTQLLLNEMVTESRDGQSNDLTIDHVEIRDGPRFAWRGVHLDVARHFFGVEDVERFIDLIAMHKCNILHLHLSDDQGFRLDVPGWPELAAVGAWRLSSPLGHESDGVDDDVAHGGFFTADDCRRLVAYAEERFVTIVPEIDLPGHVQAILAAYPEFGNGAASYDVRTRWGISDDVLNLNEETFHFCEDLLTYVGSVFPGPYLHIGGDECPTTQWRNSPAALERAESLGVRDPSRIQSLFTTRLASFVASLPRDGSGPTRETRRRAVAWDEVLDADAPRDVIVTAWRHSSEGARAARLGHQVVMAPMQFTYFDWPQSDDASEPVALTKPPWPTTLEKAYAFNVIPPGLEDEFHHLILGAQAQHWTEYIATREHLDYMALPRLAAFSEAVWCDQRDEFGEFRARLVGHLARLGALGVTFRPLEGS